MGSPKPTFRSWAALALAIAALAACGPAPDGLGSTSAGLNIPRALADELNSITIYLYETKGTAYEPTPEQLLTPDAHGTYNNYDDFKATRTLTIAFSLDQTTTGVVFRGIPDKGPVWRFYARGYQETATEPLLIAHGATPGRIDIPADGDTPTEVWIDLERVVLP